ncbi:MAG: peptide chain release factor N(5)-glutamine methyltransferase [Spirochaetales bacterium]|nr:peptide chain release factor N(5)-glutamine methyltransferase [Spirochaetales bacterium]
MIIRAALSDGAAALASVSETPFLDASLLLARALGASRERVLAMGPEELDETGGSAFRGLIARRAAGEPVAYILGLKEFRGLEFGVDERVLCPRPDTELLVEAALRTARSFAASDRAPLRIHDAFTGSGAVAVALAAELGDSAAVSMSDLSPDALELARENARRLLGHELPAALSDCMEGVDGPFELVTANPPYVTSMFCDGIYASGGKEPRLALDGGPDGLGLYRRLAPRAREVLAPGGVLAVEIGDEQGSAVSALFRAAGFGEVDVLRDLGGRDRVVLGVSP